MANKVSELVALIVGLLSVFLLPSLIIIKIEQSARPEAKITAGMFILCVASFLFFGLILCFLVWLAFGFLKNSPAECNEKECNFPQKDADSPDCSQL